MKSRLVKTSIRERQRAALEQERDIAKKVGGKRRPGSGNIGGQEHDVISERWLIEAKVTFRGSFVLKEKYLRSLVENAQKSGREPRLDIRFKTQDGDREYSLILTELLED